jgi:hypothetical protein
MGVERGLWRPKLERPFQLADLRLRAEAERVPVAFTRRERANLDAAARPADSDPETDEEVALAARGR